MRFSLVMATINRVQEVKQFLVKLEAQTYQNFELIVIDQNPDDRLVEVLQPYHEQISIIHLRSEPGLSRARNVGLKHVTGDIVAFPDDDCWYPPALLAEVLTFLKQHPEFDGLSGCPVGQSYWHREAGSITSLNVWKRGISYTIFLRRRVVEKIGLFDETLGVGSGSVWQSGEETDYLIRALRAGCPMYYSPAVQVYHPGPEPSDRPVEFDVTKCYRYALGKGRVLRKSNSPWWFFTYQCSKPLIKAVLGTILHDSEKQQVGWTVFRGILQGWRGVA